jgi:hypothetical protein
MPLWLYALIDKAVNALSAERIKMFDDWVKVHGCTYCRDQLAQGHVGTWCPSCKKAWLLHQAETPVTASVFVKELPSWFQDIDGVSFGDGILGEDYDWSSYADDDYAIELKMTIEVIRIPWRLRNLAHNVLWSLT